MKPLIVKSSNYIKTVSIYKTTVYGHVFKTAAQRHVIVSEAVPVGRAATVAAAETQRWSLMD